MSELEQYLVPIRRYSANPCMDCCCPISQCPWRCRGGVKHWVTTYAIESCPLEQGKGKKEEQWRK